MKICLWVCLKLNKAFNSMLLIFSETSATVLVFVQEESTSSHVFNFNSYLFPHHAGCHVSDSLSFLLLVKIVLQNLSLT